MPRAAAFLLCWALALLAGQAWSHGIVFPVERPPATGAMAPSQLRGGMSADAGGLALVAALALVAGARRPRRALASTLALVVIVLAFEGARGATAPAPDTIHAGGAHASPAAPPVVATPGEAPASIAPAPLLGLLALDPGPAAGPGRPAAPARDRAPPALPA